MKYLILSLSFVALSTFAQVPTPADMRGPFPIMSTPYFEDGAVDYATLAREAQFVDDSGCPGVIWCQSNDAIDLLTTDEKFKGFEACAKAVEGRKITLALGANGTNAAEMVEIAREIERVAARHPSAKIAMISRPPDDVRSEAALEAAWSALGEVAKRPVIFQTHCSKETPTPSVALMVRLAKRYPQAFGYIKEEAAGNEANDRMALENAERPAIKTIFAGWGGWQWLLQLRHCGSAGLITERCAYAPILAELWRRFEAGERGAPLTEAFAMYRLLVDQRNMPSGLRGYSLYLLMKEGVFKNMVSRQYEKAKVTEGGSFGAGRKWKLDNVTLTKRQKAELDLLLKDMKTFCANGPKTEDVIALKTFPKLSAPRAVTGGPHDHFLANYFGINAWSPDNRYLLVLETDIKNELPDGKPCTLGVVDTEDDNRFIPVTTTRCWNFQEAAMAHWMKCEKDTFVFNDMRDGKFCAVVMNWKTKAERVYPYPVSAVSEDGTWAVSINYARLYVTRPDYGYAGDGQDARIGTVFPKDDGLFRVDLRTGEAKLIVSTAAVQWMVPKVAWDGMSYLCHTVISKDMKRIYFLSRSVDQSMAGVKHFQGVNWHTTAFTCKADGSDVRRCFPDGWGSSHFNWKPNLSERDARTMIVTCKWLDKIYTHVEFTVGEEDYPRQVGGSAMNFDGHCIYSPDGKFVSSDGYWDGKFLRHWKMIRLADNKIQDVGAFFVPEPYRDIYCRCDLHPRWRPDGRQLGFNSVHEGTRQVYVIDVK